MTATRSITLWCDHDYDPTTGHRGCNDWWMTSTGGPTVKEARAAARKLGWRYITGHPAGRRAVDLCPYHASEQAQEVPR